MFGEVCGSGKCWRRLHSRCAQVPGDNFKNTRSSELSPKRKAGGRPRVLPPSLTCLYSIWSCRKKTIVPALRSSRIGKPTSRRAEAPLIIRDPSKPHKAPKRLRRMAKASGPLGRSSRMPWPSTCPAIMDYGVGRANCGLYLGSVHDSQQIGRHLPEVPRPSQVLPQHPKSRAFS